MGEKLIVFAARRTYLDPGLKLSSRFSPLVIYSVGL